MPKGQVPNTTPRIELRHNVVRCRPSALPRELGSELFRDCGADRLVALRVATRVNRTLPFHNGVVEFELHIPSRALVALAHSFAFPAVDALTCPFIRVTREQRYTSTSCAVAGMRAIIRQPSLRESDGRWALKISDYHYGRVAKARAITGNTRFASTSPLPFIEAEMVLEEMELPGTVPVCALLEDGVVVFEVDPENRRTIRNTRVYSF
ncbi:hypothetical protein BC834DRAFT_523058 [Gloeopeniophorella convolvens]|nr:hypothetical protein BC834DRAFT_523058 [Gloeopeniophorella convolvens]